jgi:uncharacterized protein (UPF0332 family)
MAFDWNEFFVLAEDLAGRVDEASKRTSISRAYYSAFHAALIRAEQNCGPKEGGNSHEWCWNRYIYTQNDACNQLGIDGKRLKARRVKADYEADTIQRLDDYVARTLSDARRLKERISALDVQYPHS